MGCLYSYIPNELYIPQTMMMVRRNGTIVTSWCHTLNQVQGYTPSISWSEFMLAPPIFQCMVSCRSRSRGKVETDFRGVLRFGSVDCCFYRYRMDQFIWGSDFEVSNTTLPSDGASFRLRGKAKNMVPLAHGVCVNVCVYGPIRAYIESVVRNLCHHVGMGSLRQSRVCGNSLHVCVVVSRLSRIFAICSL